MNSPVELFAAAAVGEGEWARLSPNMRGMWLDSMRGGFALFLAPPDAIMDRCTVAMQRADDLVEDGAGIGDLARACLAALATR